MTAIRELNSEYCVRSPVAFGPYLLLSSLYSSVVERLSRKQKVCGSIPHGGILYLLYLIVFNTTNNTFHSICSICTVARTSEHGLN
uniref:Ovule protein n=1 Tax=Heterorhabditis bacteriophora TaxID=37862 RepID=A0A1I7WKV6_HETBA